MPCFGSVSQKSQSATAMRMLANDTHAHAGMIVTWAWHASTDREIFRLGRVSRQTCKDDGEGGGGRLARYSTIKEMGPPHRLDV